MQRYPTPIQRPVNFQQVQQNPVNQKHRSNSNKTPNRQYYGNQSKYNYFYTPAQWHVYKYVHDF